MVENRDLKQVLTSLASGAGAILISALFVLSAVAQAEVGIDQAWQAGMLVSYA